MVINYTLSDFVVYMHVCDDEIIYIGSGTPSRAHCTYGRTGAWIHAHRGRPVRVVILSIHQQREEAFAAEREHIIGLRPTANISNGTKGASVRAREHRALAERKLARGRPPATTGAPRLRIVSRPWGLAFDNVRDAAKHYGVSIGTISRALATGKKVTKVSAYFEVLIPRR